MLSGSFYLAVIPNCRSELIYYIISPFVCQVLFSKFFELFFEALFKPKPFDIFPSPVPFRDSLPIISHPVPFVNPFSEVSFRTLCDLPVFGLPRGTACLYYHIFPFQSTLFGPILLFALFSIKIKLIFIESNRRYPLRLFFYIILFKSG